MLIKSGLVTQMSGSLGGMTGSHNSAGMYLRGRGLVTNPNTTYQQAVRNALSTLVTAWSAILSVAQRDDWATYAANTPCTGKLGDPLLLSGQQMYVKCNVPRIVAGLARVDDGPMTFGMANLTTPSITASEATSITDLAYTNTDTWATAAGGGLIMQMSRQVSPVINFFKGPFRFADVVLGAATPPTSPATVGSPFGGSLQIGNKLFARVVATNADGRLSPAAIIECTIAS